MFSTNFHNDLSYQIDIYIHRYQRNKPIDSHKYIYSIESGQAMFRYCQDTQF